MKKLSKAEAKERVEEFFKEVKDKSPKEIKKIKKLAMSYNIKIGDKRKKFCKKCYSPKLKVIGVKNKVKKNKCEGCENISRYKLKN